MIAGVKVLITPSGALERAAYTLQRSPKELLRTIPTADFERRALEHIRELTPRGKTRTFAYARRVFSASRNAAGDAPLKDSWRSKRDTASGDLGFTIYSLLETTGGTRGKAKLASVELGSKATVLTGSTATYSFFGDYISAPIRVVKGRLWSPIGRAIRRPAREGKHLTRRTSLFIQAVLLQDFQARVASTLERRLAKL